MLIVFGFFIPLLIYFLLYVFRARQRFRQLSSVASICVALVSSAAVLWIVFYSPQWPTGTQIAWTGLESSTGQLTIGGSREEPDIGWPNGAFAPKLKASAVGEDEASIQISGGGAFIRDDDRQMFLNGAVIHRGESKQIGSYLVRVARDFPAFWKQRLQIETEQNEVLSSLVFPIYRLFEDRVYSLQSLIENSADSHSDISNLLKTEAWAMDKRLLLSRDGNIRILSAGSEEARCKLPCSLTILWSYQSLPVRLRKDGPRLSLDLLPPWRLVSPIPPAVRGTEGQLVLTGRARPGDAAFLLPLGRGLEDLRRTITLTKASADTPVFSSQGAIVESQKRPSEYLPPGVEKSQPAGQIGAAVTSRLPVGVGPITVWLATVRDLPVPTRILALVGIALLCFILGLALCTPRMPDYTTRWVVYGLVAVLWNLLTLRLLLSIRYALEPNHLDRLSVTGVTSACISLAVVPGLILLGVRLRCDDFALPAEKPARKRAFFQASAYLVLLILALVFEYGLAQKLWLNLPARFSPSIGFLNALLGTVLIAYLAGSILILYVTEPNDSTYSLLRILFLGPFHFFQGFALRAKERWQAIAHGPRPTPLRLFAYALLAVTCFLIIPMILSWLPGAGAVGKVVVLLLFCWLPALFWLSSKLKTEGTPRLPSRTALIVCALLTIVLPVFVLPIAIHDAGSVLVTLSIFIPLVFVLLAAAPRRHGLIALGTLTVAFALAAFVYSHLLFFLPLVPGATGVRVLSFKEGSAIQRYVWFAEANEASGSRGTTAQSLQDAYQHTWQNRAIAHEGGMLGFGFGNAPVRRSHIRQDTIQYDSTFSFFVLSEYGLLGGAFLLLIFLMPVGLILVGGRLRFDVGYGFAFLITASFSLEAVLHAGMNTSAFPFSGRDLPLLSVNSLTDLFRWTILFGLAAQAALWRYTGKGIDRDANSIVSDATGTDVTSVERPGRYLIVSVALLTPLLVMLLPVVWAGWKNIRDTELDKPFGWGGLLEIVSRMAEDDILKVNQVDKTLEIDLSKINASDRSLLQQEINRFNARPLAERLGETEYTDFSAKLANVKNIADYDNLLDELRRRGSKFTDDPRPSPFRLIPPATWADETYSRSSGEYRVGPNPTFNLRLSFKTGLSESDTPRISFGDSNSLLIGPAWIMGRWVTAIDPGGPVPWTAELADALTAEWSRLGAREASERYSNLLLDQRLHEAAVRFCASKGRGLHRSLLSSTPVLPPRIALSILSLPKGEVLALGGWPRMTSDRFWRRSDDDQEWIPPIHWIDQKAPMPLRLLYGGDRNFDRIVVGSATKPIWASAVLAVHPRLDQQLRVRGSDDEESDVFGIKLPSPWHVSRRDWLDFASYLAQSDNRYQVRLGFLGLSDVDGADIASAGASASEKESLNGRTPAPWRKYPRFQQFLGFSSAQPGALNNLYQTSLARHLKGMYSIGISSQDFSRRISFWTKDENDDLRQPSRRGRPSELFNAISPEVVNLSFGAISSPRDFVSLLLGGGTNLWSNVDFAGAFATCVTGNPVLPHVIRNASEAKLLDDRERFPATAARLRRGLMSVVSDGTATGRLRESGALVFLRGQAGFSVYAKTGTLKARGGRETSRIALAIIRWENEQRGTVRSGLVFSLVGEQAQMGTATQWLGEFLIQNRPDIERLLSVSGAQPRRSTR